MQADTKYEILPTFTKTTTDFSSRVKIDRFWCEMWINRTNEATNKDANF